MIAGFLIVSQRIFLLSKVIVAATWFEGNYSEYEADRAERLGEDAVINPHRIKYKKLG